MKLLFHLLYFLGPLKTDFHNFSVQLVSNLRISTCFRVHLCPEFYMFLCPNSGFRFLLVLCSNYVQISSKFCIHDNMGNSRHGFVLQGQEIDFFKNYVFFSWLFSFNCFWNVGLGNGRIEGSKLEETGIGSEE